MAANIQAVPQDSDDFQLYAQLNGNLFMMLKMIELDKCFNLGASSTDTHINIEKFQEDLNDIAEEERQHGEMTQLNKEQSNDLEEDSFIHEESQLPIIPGKIGPTVSSMMKNYLADHKMDVPLLNAFTQFVNEHIGDKEISPIIKSSENKMMGGEIEGLIDKSKSNFLRFVQIEDVFQ